MTNAATTPDHTAALAVDHPTAVIFLDETGVVDHASDRFFGIGCLKTTDHATLSRELSRLRDRYGFNGELHWSSFDKAMMRGRGDIVQMARDAIDIVFDSAHASFVAVIADRQHGDLTATFKRHKHPRQIAYQHFATDVLTQIIGGEEVVSVLADHQSTPPEVHFENNVKTQVNASHARLAVTNVCRLDSRCTDGLQLIDLILGAAALDLRQGRVPESDKQKQQLLGHLLDRCDCPSFRPSGRRDPDGKYDVQILTKQTGHGRGNRGR